MPDTKRKRSRRAEDQFSSLGRALKDVMKKRNTGSWSYRKLARTIGVDQKTFDRRIAAGPDDYGRRKHDDVIILLKCAAALGLSTVDELQAFVYNVYPQIPIVLNVLCSNIPTMEQVDMKLVEAGLPQLFNLVEDE